MWVLQYEPRAKARGNLKKIDEPYMARMKKYGAIWFKIGRHMTS